MVATAPTTSPTSVAAQQQPNSAWPAADDYGKQNTSRTTALSSAFVAAVLGFFLLSLLAASFRLGKNEPSQFPFMGWTAWAIKDYLGRAKPPNIAFLGSSLMLVPLSGVDADHLNRRLDGALHHQSVYVQDEFKRRTGCAIETFNFALPGEMPSDAFMITDFILKRNAPNVIVYGVGPRDFTDNLLPSPSSTDPFRFLSRFADVTPYASLMMPDWQERLSFELGKCVFFYGERSDLVANSQALAASLLSQLCPLPAGTIAQTADQRHALIPEYMPTQLHQGQAFFRPTTKEERKHFTDNLEEYKRRYAKLKRGTFDTQLAFFEETLKSARQAGTHCVIIGMPITAVNRQLLPDSTWRLYCESIQRTALLHGATFIDLSASRDFSHNDFCDTVHLHSGGGKKLLDKLVAAITADKKVLAAVMQNQSRRFLSDKQGGGCAAN